MSPEGGARQTREVVSPARLYAILHNEFRRLRPPGCERCQLPLPIFRPPPDETAANWHVGTPQTCPDKCHLVIAEITARAWSKYDLEVPQ
jgi:hypothetical protein